MRKDPVISDWVQFRGASTVGSLGRGLAQRQAALRGKMAAGARFNFSLFRACRLNFEHLAVPRKTFFWKFRLTR